MVNDDTISKYFFNLDVTEIDIECCDPQNGFTCAISKAINRDITSKYMVTSDFINIEDIEYKCNKWLKLWQYELIVKTDEMKPITVSFDRQQFTAKIDKYRPKTFTGFVYIFTGCFL